MIRCECCYYSEMIDGTLYCHHKEEDVLCGDYEGLEYNVEKYIDQFNKRITPLLVCFHPDIRNKILITNPKDRLYFTE